MPELPEVETVLSGLKQILEGHVIKDARIYSPKLRNVIPERLRQTLVNQRVEGMRRRAKYMVWDLDNEQSIIVHLGMTGVFRTLLPSQEKYQHQTHDHLWMRLDNGLEIVYRDPRRFGVIDTCPTAQVDQSPYLAHLGIEPLDKKFTASKIYPLLAARKISIKQAIMDQELVVGVGNIYASEALFMAGIDPRKSAKDVGVEELDGLVKAIKKILKSAIKAGGSTLRDYRKIGGERGYFQTQFSVYDREGSACPDCTCKVNQTGGIKRIVQGNRSTFYCPRKQK
ncbi:MAG: DNA-formamidopyrimidine glycosylase [Alphaproteobacteria bacterium CG1_02_46_17]|nr:MAG: DNA-formamidopyrimidine glycosylase [Alphaproteobacteria bacterium CG1_02_46_17]